MGAVVHSRQIDVAERFQMQATLERAMAHINERHRAVVLADFLVTLGDQFQGVLRHPRAVPDIVQDLREQFPRFRFRIAVSRGELPAMLKPPPTTAGVAFAGFGDDDIVLDGIAELLTYHWTHLEDSQREILTALRDPPRQAARKDIAARLRISPQALSNRAQSAGWREYTAGLAAWRALLERHTVS
jgi:predicted DNA binding protein